MMRQLKIRNKKGIWGRCMRKKRKAFQHIPLERIKEDKRSKQGCRTTPRRLEGGRHMGQRSWYHILWQDVYHGQNSYPIILGVEGAHGSEKHLNTEHPQPLLSQAPGFIRVLGEGGEPLPQGVKAPDTGGCCSWPGRHRMEKHLEGGEVGNKVPLRYALLATKQSKFTSIL